MNSPNSKNRLRNGHCAAFVFALSTVIATPALAGVPASPLVGVTGNGGITPETLFSINTTDASMTLLAQLGHGDDGETIAFNPFDRHIYHWSGMSANPTIAIMERIHPGSFAITDIPWDGFRAANPLFSAEAKGATYDEDSGNFFTGDSDRFLYTVTPDGTVTTLGHMDHQPMGFAIIGSTLYSIDKFPGSGAKLRTINPANGATITTTQITLAGVTITNGISLTHDPATGVLWGVLKQSLPNSQIRHLVTIDPATGVATSIGVLSDNIATIVFIPEDPCPADFNRDGFVNLADLQLLLFSFGQPGTVLDGDANGDGVVNLDDLQILLFLFGMVCP